MSPGADPELTPSPAGRAWLVLLLGAALGSAFFVHYYGAGLTTAHYDAKAHLVVARRLIDSLEPGYMQLGAHWLPLVHVLYLPFVLVDVQYRSGMLPSLLSVLAFALSGWLAYRIAVRATGEAAAGWFAAILLLANPNLLYLQSCPLTEPVSVFLLLASVDALMAWRGRRTDSSPWLAGVFASLGALCRYEGWVLVGAAVLLLLADIWWMRIPWRRAVRSAATLCALSAGPLLLHFGYVYYKLRDGFLIRVARGNPAPYETFHNAFLSLAYHAGEVVQITSALVFVIGIAGVVFALSRRERIRAWAPLFLLWTPSAINVAALYWGHIYRVRYSVLLLPAAAVFGALLCVTDRAARRALAVAAAVAVLLPWLTWYFPQEWRYHGFRPGPGLLVLPAGALLAFLAGSAWGHRRWMLLGIGVLGMHLPVLAAEVKPIMTETMEHAFIEPERQRILQELRERYDSTRILIDMGKLAPLVFDSRLPVREFVYNEGSRQHWDRALRSPASEVGWICVERGDEFYGALQIDPGLVDGYALAVQTDNLSLYRRTAQQRVPAPTTGRLE